MAQGTRHGTHPLRVTCPRTTRPHTQPHGLKDRNLHLICLNRPPPSGPQDPQQTLSQTRPTPDTTGIYESLYKLIYQEPDTGYKSSME